MVHEKMSKKKIREMCGWLQYYDDNGKFPFDKVRVNVVLSHKALMKVGRNGRSGRIEKMILGGRG